MTRANPTPEQVEARGARQKEASIWAVRRLQTALGIASVFLLAYAPSGFAADPPLVTLSTWEQGTNGTRVEFPALKAVSEVSDSVSLDDETSDGAFEYGIDTDGILWADECRCFRYYVILVRSQASGTVTKHKFKALPSGSFDDQRADVRLTISDGAKRSVAEISLPIASAPGLEPKPLIEVSTREGIAAVALAGHSQILLTLKNATRRMSVEIPGEIGIVPANGNLWRAAPTLTIGSAPLKTPLVLKPGATQDVILTVEPVLQAAVRESFIPKDKDVAHTSVTLQVLYRNPVFGNRDGVSELTIPIRFHPTVVALAAALLVGVLLGALIQLRKYRTRRKWILATATALGVAIVFELIGVFLVSRDSKFVIFSFSLDPLQTLPVLLLGIGNGFLGFEAARRLKFIDDEKS